VFSFFPPLLFFFLFCFYDTKDVFPHLRRYFSIGSSCFANLSFPNIPSFFFASYDELISDQVPQVRPLSFYRTKDFVPSLLASAEPLVGPFQLNSTCEAMIIHALLGNHPFDLS